MKVVVASRNPVKLGAAEQAFVAAFPDATVKVVPVDVASDVSDQPASDAETRRGAQARARNARDTLPDADYWVGMEGGTEQIDGRLLAFAWMVVRDAKGRTGAARSVTLPLPPAVKALVEGGLELGEANDRVFSTVNSKQGGGAFGLLTDGRYTREGVYAETLAIAMLPLVHALYREDARAGSAS